MYKIGLWYRRRFCDTIKVYDSSYMKLGSLYIAYQNDTVKLINVGKGLLWIKKDVTLLKK